MTRDVFRVTQFDVLGGADFALRSRDLHARPALLSDVMHEICKRRARG